MGWTITLKSDREISIDDVSKVVDALPPKLIGYASAVGCKIRQSWGWSAGVDIYNPQNKTLKLHGSYSMSGDIAEESAKFISVGLKKLGYKIRIGEIS